MAIIKSIFSALLVIILVTKSAFSLYEDQIGKFDWKKDHIGKLKFAEFDSVKRVVIATEENVLASLNLKNGQIVWRQLLEHSDVHSIELMHLDTEVITVSGNGNIYYVRGWDLNTGVLQYEWSLSTEKSGKWIATKTHLIHVVAVVNSHVEVTKYEIKTGMNKGSSSRISTPWMTNLEMCVLAGTHWTCISSESSEDGKIYSIDLNGDMNKIVAKSLDHLIGAASGAVKIKEFKHSEPAILLERNHVHRLVLIGENPTVLPYSLESNVISLPGGEHNSIVQMEVVRTSEEKPLQLKTFDLETNDQKIIPLEPPYTAVAPHLVSGICRGSNCRIVYNNDDNAIVLLQLPAGKVQWVREEALSEIVALEFVDLPLSDLEASIEREFNEASSDIFSMFMNRLVSQTRQMTTLITGKPTASGNVLVRDNFGLHKLIVVATKVGKLFALDTITGEIIWSRYLRNIAPFDVIDKKVMVLYLQRTARYAPLSAEMTLVAKHSIGGEGVVFKFDPITGKSIGGINMLNFKIKQATLLPFEDKTHVKGLILLAENNQIHVYPPNAKSMLKDYTGTMFLYNADSEKSILTGYTLIYGDEENPQATPTWQLNLAGSKFVALSMRPSIERVHSQGRVLADRSVFYKYVNPNLIALATVSDDAMHKHVLSVYLVDGVTGLVVFSAHHKRANGPVHMVHSENWIVYSYFSERFRRYEMTSVELYEGAKQSNSTAFSSHALSQLPHPESLSYIMPATPLGMTTTLTERGITNKHLLIALSNGGILELPWAFVEPRGPHLASTPEEGYIPYMPEIPIHTESIINYNQSLARIKGIQVSPAKLESTSLVIAFGLDIFYTRVTPSKTFDVLKEDFDHWLIIMVLVGLTLASYVTKRLSIRKALKQQWK
ncbi:PREDICTED: ER membrane protein complex subunit 1 [Nicrophorus vespilloides]|uniref:ER membrane protein complex subunit 1 n=1 Tax=Nicrophorus vespilloides TaxID=110193 RepID=A0ABM1MTZ8_NICVS|nr:PREDICTED: ER membrane protein complex subunit 1 [Nicrophorus vespilloides]